MMDGLEKLIERVEGPLPVRMERGEEVWKLELNRDERNLLAEALYKAHSASMREKGTK